MVQKFLTKTTYSKFSQKMLIQVTVVKRSGVVIRGSPLSTRVPLSQNQPLPHRAHGSPVRRDCLQNWINPKKKRNFWAKNGRQRFAKLHWNVCFGGKIPTNPILSEWNFPWHFSMGWEVRMKLKRLESPKAPPFSWGNEEILNQEMNPFEWSKSFMRSSWKRTAPQLLFPTKKHILNRMWPNSQCHFQKKIENKKKIIISILKVKTTNLPNRMIHTPRNQASIQPFTPTTPTGRL